MATVKKIPKSKNFPCPFCKGKIRTYIPTKALLAPGRKYWDSGVACPHCKRVFFKKVWPNGKSKP